MDPLSITTSCLALAGCIAKVSGIVIEFTRDARNANKDMDAISAELQALADILTPFTTSLPTLTTVPETLLRRVNTIIVGCATVVDQIDKQLVRYKRNKVFAKIGWVVFGQSDMQKLRDNLTGYKTALNLGIQIISISLNQVVKNDTTAIREQNEALMANVDTILAQLKDTQPAKSSAPRKRIEEWMNDIDALTSYAETTYAETVVDEPTVADEPTVTDEPAVADDPTTDTPDQPLPDQPENCNVFQPVYHEGDPGKGIGGYNLRSPNDRCFALDYNSTGKLDHLVLFRPGTGIISILHRDPSGAFTPVFHSSFGIDAYDLLDLCDRALAFDYTSTGHLDHILLYRRGHGILYVLARSTTTNTYTTVFKSHSGIAGLDLASPLDRIFAFDYSRSGKQDHLAIYRPGTGTFWILRNDMHTTSAVGSSATFTPVYKSTTSPDGVGIGGYPLLRDHDRAFAFDWEGTGKMDHIVLYRGGGDGLFSVVGRDHETGGFSTVWTTAVGAGGGVGGYDLADPRDVAFAYDWGHTGRRDHVVLYRPGAGTLGVMARDRNTDHGWKCVFGEGGGGVGGYDLLSDDDKVFAFDYEAAGRADCLVAYRANGTGTIWILKHV